MKSFTSECIVLGHRNFGESDKLVFLYSKDFGKIRVIAKGARKITSKFTGHLETLNSCTSQLYFGPRNIILTEISTKTHNKRIREDFKKLCSALQIAEVTNQILYDNQSLENLIPLLEGAIQQLAKTEKASLLAIAYTTKLLDKTGLIPDFKKTGGSMDMKYRKFFEFIKKASLEEIEQITLTESEQEEIKKIIKKLFEYHTERKFKSLDLL